ncbi:16S rRNA (adenine(1518)-N(6)/adenine(1519)-N(6))-dimethyltransferase RsmA [Candidatus Glomeribacter gigasporarum]|uniref:16S rRNA (adenine(1518)-N(6)/adenine(1519)-N(6))- dimethyltransferase RsmA n=1 Tax=Candidatus Glomeribacter gigasporarum TaxID=132144 RepID=UPI003B969C4A
MILAKARIQGHTARKRFGQHFLIDSAVIDAIVSAIAPAPQDCLVEIGPGLGALTWPLLERLGGAGRLHAIEMDRDLAAHLQRLGHASLILHAGDALRFDFAQLARAEQARLRIVGNLPYNISSPLLFHLLDEMNEVVDQHFMLQREVAARIAAAPGSAHYGRLSVMLQSRYAVERLFDVPPCAFAPPPAVHSAVLRMAPHASRALPQLDWARFAALVRAAFSQRRKILRHTLSVYQKTPDFDALGFDLGRRAQEVPVGEYLKLAQHIEQNAHPNPKP